MARTPFHARHSGRCPACGSTIHVDDLITYSDEHEAAVHVSCDDARPEKPETVCPRCFLTICDCERGDAA